jgi:hypothetical protein
MVLLFLFEETASKQNMIDEDAVTIFVNGQKNVRKDETMKSCKILLCVGALAASIFLVGCSGGGSQVKSRPTTVGEELMDLDEAYKQGIITEKEYNRKKQEILKKY